MFKNRPHVALGILIVWLCGVLVYTRYAMLDDALIHLRYASFLHDVHFITFDGVHPSFGTSSLVYVYLLAALRGLSSTPMLPKIVSVCFFTLSVAFLIWRFFQMAPKSMGRLITAGLLLAVSAAMGVRWLTDGMETSFVLLMSLLLSLISWKEMRRPATDALSAVGLMAFGLAMTLLRIELSMLLGISCLAILVARWGRQEHRSAVAELLGAAYLGFGAVLAAAIVYLHFHALLPDTALAKSHGHASLGPVFGVAHVLASSFLLGLGTFFLWVLSAAVAFVHVRRRPEAGVSVAEWTICNSSFPLLVTLACVQAQSIQGVRYVLWALTYSLFWNMLVVSDVPTKAVSWYPKAVAATAVLLLLLLPADVYFAFHSMMGRAQTFLQMQNAGLDRYKGQTLAAGDVGFISYFTRANVCDIDGLVNGRHVAALSTYEKLQRCAALKPSVLFLSPSQARYFNQLSRIGDWAVCSTVDFVNVNGNDRHHLLTPRPQDCVSPQAPVKTLRETVPDLGR